MRIRIHPVCAVAVFALAGCNLLTGADQFVIRDDGGGGEDDDSPDGPGPAGPSGPGSGGSTGSSSTGGEAPTLGDATGVSIEEIAFYQGVKSTVMENGAAIAPTVRLVAGRQAVVRVAVSLAQPSGTPLTARLYLGSNAPIEVVISPSKLGSPSDGEIESTINFDVPSSHMTVGGDYRLEILEPVASAATSNPGAHFPATGTQNLAVQASGRLKVTLIPVRYNADGSGRLPDTSPGQLDAYRRHLGEIYPVTNVDLTVGPIMDWSGGIDAGGNGWDSLLDELSQRRVNSNAASDEFYYGIFNPASSFGGFCGGGCTAGLGFIGDPQGEYSRAAIGLGFAGDVSLETAAHELGHNHGRPHSPCGNVAGADQNYPHSGGSIGVWGMGIFDKSMKNPGQYKDLMSYCDPAWVSDYVYEEMLDFRQALGTMAIQYPPESLNRTYDRVRIGANDATWLPALRMPRPPMGGLSRTVTVETSNGTTQLQGTFYKYDHLEGGVLFIPPTSAQIQSVAVDIERHGVIERIALQRPAH